MVYSRHYDSPLGRIWMTSDGKALTGLWFDRQAHTTPIEGETGADGGTRQLPVFDETVRWLDCYFSGRDPGFTPPLALHGTPFRQAVWKILLEIPFGTTMTYGQIAARLDCGRDAGRGAGRGAGRMSAQAVGGAVGHNPIALIVPCHRVIGAGGSLTGYAAGLDRKAWLLTLEHVFHT